MASLVWSSALESHAAMASVSGTVVRTGNPSSLRHLVRKGLKSNFCGNLMPLRSSVRGCDGALRSRLLVKAAESSEGETDDVKILPYTDISKDQKMTRGDLNVEYSGIRTTIDVMETKRMKDIRKAIKAEFSNLFAEVDAPLIQLYDQRGKQITYVDDIADDYYKEPKNGGLCLDIRISTPTKTQLASFPPCQISFYNTIGEATEGDGYLEFAHPLPSSTLRQIFIRESYRCMATRIQNPAPEFQYKASNFEAQSSTSNIPPTISKAIITGTPGTGKSVFLFYLLWQLVKTRKRVLFIHHPDTIYYDGQGGVFRLLSLPLPLNDSFWNSSLWCLFDAKEKKAGDLSALPYSECTFVVSTSPRRGIVNDFQKPPPPQIFYMPVWTEAELETIAPLFPNACDWRVRFKILGGIPRHVLEVTHNNPMKILEKACDECSLDDCLRVIGFDSFFTEKSRISHSLIHIRSSFPFTESSVNFSSEIAKEIFVSKLRIISRHRVRSFLESTEGSSYPASLRGYIFEPYAMELLERGGSFSCYQLVHGSKESMPQKMKLKIPPSKKKFADKPDLNQERNQLYVPRSKNFPAIDAWIPGIGAFQMTISDNHAIRGDIKSVLPKLGRGGNKLYWLLPPLQYYSFTKKTPKDIDQYAVLIPYPSVDD